MKKWSKEGYALPLAVISVILLVIIGFGLYASVEQVVKEVKIEETESIKGHYAALSGLRYAMILLRDPEGLFGYPPGANDSVTMSLWTHYNTVAQDMGLSNNRDISLTITKRADGDFDVSATYSY